MFSLPMLYLQLVSMTVFLDFFGKYFLQNALIHPAYLKKSYFEQSLPCQIAIKQD